MNTSPFSRCDLFCRIIDNFGDIGVCWRLARQLTHEHDIAVTLWVDDLSTFKALAPELDLNAPQQTIGLITIRHWQKDVNWSEVEPAPLIIEGFGCALPSAYLEKMAAQSPPPHWFNLEYLSAEKWVEDCHSLRSTHPSTGLKQTFWFPGFTLKTGGLLRESDVIPRRDALQNSRELQLAFWMKLGLEDALSFDRRMSLFAYENPAIPTWLEALAQAPESTLVVLPIGRALSDVQTWAGQDLRVGQRFTRGNVSISVIPLLTTDAFDQLLWACDLNAVRGEDSFVRAQWAGRPMLWHIYPQTEATHLIKLNAFLDVVDASDFGQNASFLNWKQAMLAWNQAENTPFDWSNLVHDLPKIKDLSIGWCNFLLSQPDLAQGMMHFCRTQVE